MNMDVTINILLILHEAFEEKMNEIENEREILEKQMNKL